MKYHKYFLMPLIGIMLQIIAMERLEKRLHGTNSRGQRQMSKLRLECLAAAITAGALTVTDITGMSIKPLTAQR